MSWAATRVWLFYLSCCPLFYFTDISVRNMGDRDVVMPWCVLTASNQLLFNSMQLQVLARDSWIFSFLSDVPIFMFCSSVPGTSLYEVIRRDNNICIANIQRNAVKLCVYVYSCKLNKNYGQRYCPSVTDIMLFMIRVPFSSEVTFRNWFKLCFSPLSFNIPCNF